MKPKLVIIVCWIFCCCAASINVSAAVYDIGPEKPYQNLSDFDWDGLKPGDIVQIHYREKPYQEKLALNRSGKKGNPIVIRGIPNSNGRLPVIDGDNAVHFQDSFYASIINRGLIIVGCDKPADHIVISGLEIKNANNANAFYFKGQSIRYAGNANGIFIKQGKYVKILNNVIHSNCVGVQTAYYPFVDMVLLSGNTIFNNGDFSGTRWGHNVYLCGKRTIVEFNRFGELRSDGNNIKDRSQTLIVRYNWIQGGMSRQIDMVESERYPKADAFVYGNVIINGKKVKNPKMVLFGGDSSNEQGLSKGNGRNGTLYFFNNTVHYTGAGLDAFLVVNRPGCQAFLYNNAFFGGQQVWLGEGRVLGSNNLFQYGTDTRGLVNSFFGGLEQVTARGNIPYIPSSNSILMDRGTAKIPLQVKYMPLPAPGRMVRKIRKNIDIGAYELNATTFSLK